MSKKYDVVYGQKYTSNGEEKTKWINCGAVIQTKNGFALKLEAVPVGFDGWFQLFEPKPRETEQQAVDREFNKHVGREVAQLGGDCPF